MRARADQGKQTAPRKQCFEKLHLGKKQRSWPLIPRLTNSAAYCDECGERFGVWCRKGCSKHPYSQRYNIAFKGVRDNWPDHKIEMYTSDGNNIVIDNSEDHFTDILSPFMYDEPKEEDNHRYPHLRCINWPQSGVYNTATLEAYRASRVHLDTGTLPITKNVRGHPLPGAFMTGTLPPSPTPLWRPTGMKKKETKLFKQARATEGRAIARQLEARKKLELEEDEQARASGKAKKAAKNTAAKIGQGRKRS